MRKKNLLQISLKGPLAGSKALQEAARHFHKHDFVRFPLFFSEDILQFIKKRMASAAFARREHKGIATELCMKTNSIAMLLTALMNDYKLFRLIDKITGCGPLGCFTGRIYRMSAGEHYDSWHDDWVFHRKIALSVNISEKVYRGGCLMLRPKNKPKEITEVPNTGFGDAVIFRLGKELEHQVSALQGSAAKTAYAGWFRTQPDYFKSVKKISAVRKRS